MSVHTVHADNPHRHRLRPRDCEEQPLLRSKRRRTLRLVVHGPGVLVYLLSDLSVVGVHLCPCEFTTVSSVRKDRRVVATLTRSRGKSADRPRRRASADDFAKSLVVGVRACVCARWNGSDRAVRVCVCADLWAILKMPDLGL